MKGSLNPLPQGGCELQVENHCPRVRGEFSIRGSMQYKGSTKVASISEASGISGYAPGKFPGSLERPTLNHCLPLPVPMTVPLSRGINKDCEST